MVLSPFDRWITSPIDAKRRPKKSARGQHQSLLRGRPGLREPQIRASHNAVAYVLCDDWRMATTVLIVDDHAAFRESVGALLQAEGFVVVGEAADGAAAIAEVERLRPAVVLLDIQLPDLDGFTVADQIAATPDPPAIVFVSSRDAAAYGPRLEAAAARGFIAKRELSGAALAALVC
jgi:CheY-like chemotaxis protein